MSLPRGAVSVPALMMNPDSSSQWASTTHRKLTFAVELANSSQVSVSAWYLRPILALVRIAIFLIKSFITVSTLNHVSAIKYTHFQVGSCTQA